MRSGTAGRGLGRNAAGSGSWGAQTRLTKHLGTGNVLASGRAGQGLLLALPDVAGASVGSCGIRYVRGHLDRARDLAWAFPDEIWPRFVMKWE